MRSPALLVILLLLTSACSQNPSDATTTTQAFDPNVPPSTPTVTKAATGFTTEHMETEPSSAPTQAKTVSPNAPGPPSRGVATRIPPDERLHYLSMPAMAGLKAGAFVDLIGIFPLRHSAAALEKDPSEAPGHVSMVMLQNIRVLDVRPPSAGRVQAGVAVTVDELEFLLITATRGTIRPLLRPAGETQIDSNAKFTLREVLEDLEVTQEKRQIRLRRAGAAIGTGTIARGERGLVMSNPLPAGVLKSGDQVDVFGTFPIEESAGEHVTMTLLQRVEVVRAGDDELQLSVTQEEAAMLLLSQTRGELSFGMRNREDIRVTTVTRKTLRDALEDSEVIQEKRQIRIRRSGKRKKAAPSIEIIAGDRRGSGHSIGHNWAPGALTRSETYVNPGQNHWVATADDNLSTFAADVDGGSFTIARRKLNEGTMPPPDSVRPEEWVNYFTYGYPQPTDGPFGVSLEAAPSPFQTGGNYRLLRVGVQAKNAEATTRQPVHLTFLVDVSGSMNSDDKLGYATKALKYLVDGLQPHDTVAITTYAGRTETLLEPTTVEYKGKILAAIGNLRVGGGTAMDDGLRSAYALADAAFVEGHENRVIVLSDGDANIGKTSVEQMLETIASGAKRGITMSTIGFGLGNYKDAAMEQLANKGNGNYYYIDGLPEIRKVFGDQLNATLQTVARDVKLQIEFDRSAVRSYRLIGYENRDIADQDFRNDSVDAGEMGAGHSVTALYELEMIDPGAPTIATVRIRHRKPDNKGPTYETTATMRGIDMASKLADTSYSFQFAAAVAAFAEIVRGSAYASHLNLEWVREVADAAVAEKADRRQLVELIDRASTILKN